MAYCTVSDAKPYLTNITLSSTTDPSEEEVSKMCDDVSDNIIDPIIRNYIDLPLTDTVGLAYLKQGAIYFVISSVNRSFFGMTELVISLEARFDAFLERLKTNNALLITNNSDYPKTAHNTRRDIKYNLDHDEDIW